MIHVVKTVKEAIEQNIRYFLWWKYNSDASLSLSLSETDFDKKKKCNDTFTIPISKGVINIYGISALRVFFLSILWKLLWKSTSSEIYKMSTIRLCPGIFPSNKVQVLCNLCIFTGLVFVSS